MPALTKLPLLPALPRLAATIAVGAGLMLAAGTACAQYRIVDADGHVTYTDKPPAAPARGVAPQRPATAQSSTPAGGTMGAELQRAAARYPVTLYASNPCAPCDQARSWLRGRGVPFSEYSINTEADVRALAARYGERNVPLISIGQQLVRGYSSSELAAYVDAAGYPAQSQLRGYAWPAAVPLAPPPTVEAAASAPTIVPTPDMPQRKPGIQF